MNLSKDEGLTKSAAAFLFGFCLAYKAAHPLIYGGVLLAGVLIGHYLW